MRSPVYVLQIKASDTDGWTDVLKRVSAKNAEDQLLKYKTWDGFPKDRVRLIKRTVIEEIL